MVEQVTFQTIFQFLQTVGILVGVYYYIMTIRTNQRNQELQLETRQAQLFSTIFEVLYSEASMRQYIDTIYHMEWEDFDDFWEKYGPINNPEAYSKINSIFWTYGEIGILVFDGLLDIIRVGKLVGEVPLKLYRKYEPILYELREHIGSSVAYLPFEYLATRLAAEWRGKPVVSVIEHMQRDIQSYKELIELKT